MTTGILVAAVLYASAHLLLLLVGVVFAVRNAPMPYHLDALGAPLAELPPGAGVLLSNSVGLLGTSWTALASAQLVLIAFPLQQGELWARLAVPAIGLVNVAGLLRAMRNIGRQTAGHPPIAVGWLALGLILAGFAASWL
ncbi:MAG: hypothetical protein H6737_30980 [Alphaproteobacteria bacterium]|nr:hypothetical protein [Alphaproteobacteria bacterium]